MPRVRLSGRPFSSSASHQSARVLMTRSATISIASSRSSSVQEVAYGALYLTLNSRVGLFTSCSDADPFGQRRPREIGLAGSPSIWVTFSSLTYTFWPQPTAQYGQIDCTTRSAVFVRGVRSSERLDCAAYPSPRGSRSCRKSGGILVLPATARESTPRRVGLDR